MIKNERRPGTVSTEVAIGITLSVVVLFVAVGLFNDNISSMMGNKDSNGTNMKKMYSSNALKEKYDPTTKADYSQSQVNVQIMGEQGLQQMRKTANNKAIELMGGTLSPKNPDGNSIAYLGLAAKALSGESHICVYMKNDSDKFCDEKSETPPSIGGYNYKIDAGSGSALTVSKVDITGTAVLKNGSDLQTAAIPIDGAVGALLSQYTVPTDADGRSTLSEDQKYKFIKDISVSFAPYVRPDVLLINVMKTFDSTQNTTATATTTVIKSEITDFQTLIASLIYSAKEANSICNGRDFMGMRGNYDAYGCGGYYRIEDSDMTNLNNWNTDITNYLTAPNAATSSKTDIATYFMNSLTKYNVVETLRNDNYHCNSNNNANNNATTILKSKLGTINQTYSLNISVPSCSPKGVKGTGLVALVSNVGTTVKKVVNNVVNAVKKFFSGW